MVARFGPELGAYAELIATASGAPVGLLVRGDGVSFTDRVSAQLQALGFGPGAMDHHRWMAEWFDHRVAFFKLELSLTPDGDPEWRAGCYFRRRPKVDAVLERYAGRVAAPVLRELREWSGRLGKDSVHFVAAAMTPGAPPVHKLYFTQLRTPQTEEKVERGLTSMFGGAPTALAAWRAGHRAMPRPAESTVFASRSFSSDAMLPGFKLDYMGIDARSVGVWDRAAPAGAEALARDGSRLSYLGLRFDPSRSSPVVKLYADAEAPPGPLEAGPG